MPMIHQRMFRVRHCECDANGYVHRANYLNYMLEAAFDASAAAGYDVARYDAMGLHWLIHETDIEYQHPLRYEDSVEVKTWVVDFRRVRSRRAYELRLAESGELVARASTDWVLLDSGTGRPTSIPPEMMEAFFPEGVPEKAPPRSRFPPAPAPPPGVFRLRRRVEWRDIDPARHVNNAIYLAYLEDCSIQALGAYGWSQARVRDEGLAVVARRYQIEYRQPGLLGDELELATWLSDVKRFAAVRHYSVSRVSDHALLAQARVLWEAADVKTGQPTPFPGTLMADLAPNTTERRQPKCS